MPGSLLFFILAVAGAVVAICHGLIPPLAMMPQWATNLVGGAIGGGLVAGVVFLSWRKLAAVLNEEAAGRRMLSSFALGFVATGIGAILFVAIGLVFVSGVGVRIAQGAILAGSLLLGLRVGYLLEIPFYPVVLSGSKTTCHVRTARSGMLKYLDTSVIIDGRIGGLSRTGFIEGEILVPEFVLTELQNIADSSNSLRRRKGRRGLEILRELMQDDSVKIRVVTRDYPSIKEVDRKLIRLVKEQNGTLVTTDYNLNRVAQVEGIRILNINELANAVKPPFIPGEEIAVEVIDRGEEIGQGVGYLDDGTMVVVENGRRHIGRKIKATVKSTLQTEAGRMLFVEPAGENPRWEK